ncbi:hypothetical protein [Roseibium sediminis]|uniref:hypothetical protein n=1 Tax=Roseibium sediminis TaxID=1775174 RepID=UPI00123CD9D6|nr:hypothetical protein [Roseibium sediminis]
MTLAAEIEREVSAAGFHPVGTIVSDRDEAGSSVVRHDNPCQLLLVGSLGSDFWTVFSASTEAADGLPDAMDRFTRRVLGGLAETFGVEVLFPFDGPPYYPFQRWAKAYGGFSQSPLGVLAHESYGPWLGLRGAFVLPGVGEGEREPHILADGRCGNGPCGACVDKPCLNVCPVNAISSSQGYDYMTCRAYLSRTQDAACWHGCLARRACPFGQEHAHVSEQARFHMMSFVGS